MTETTTDCRSFDGVTVGLIDTIINCSRLLKHRDQMAPAVQEALADLRHDEDVERLLGGADMDIRDRMRAEIKALRENSKSKYPLVHANLKVPGAVTQYDDEVFIWRTLDGEMRNAKSLKLAFAHLASHLRIRGVL